MRALVTGAEGFLGSTLVDLLLAEHIEVYGTVYGTTENIARHIIDRDNFTAIDCDLRLPKQVARAVDMAKPEYIFHLASQSYPTVSWSAPKETLETNIIGTFNLLDCLRKKNMRYKVIMTSSSAVYGVRDEQPIKEIDPRNATNFYAASKIAMEELAKVFKAAYGMAITTVRPFNMTGPRKTGDACSDFVRQVVKLEQSVSKYSNIIEVGNLSTTRDITDGRDAARALLTLSQLGTSSGIYNLCSGQGFKMKDVLRKILKISGHEGLDYIQDPARMRPTDDPVFIGDNTRLRALGWEPKISLDQTIRDMLDYWRNRS